ncbi:MAG: hypothetical protein D3916_04975 [Candidatus Electrothrix sp. MAN1_4]|nr:hypothetical protein [Candidatus Electrothrix sp. MAN1_4]
MGETLYELLFSGQFLLSGMVVIISFYMDNRAVIILEVMSENINAYNGQRLLFLYLLIQVDIGLFQILFPQIPTKPCYISGEFSLLQLNQHQLAAAVRLPYFCGKINPQYSQAAVRKFSVQLGKGKIKGFYFLFNDVGYDQFGNPHILHQVFEHDIVQGICDFHWLVPRIWLKTLPVYNLAGNFLPS